MLRISLVLSVLFLFSTTFSPVLSFNLDDTPSSIIQPDPDMPPSGIQPDPDMPPSGIQPDPDMPPSGEAESNQ